MPAVIVVARIEPSQRMQLDDRVIEVLDPYRSQWGREMAHRAEVRRVRRPGPKRTPKAVDDA
ncbi:MAG TPA: hypothetical protein PKE40_08205 [Arachnia sp.]|nr:hypothetical protein [Arachnia sp.]HMT86318.1 hypothetical protein [Arachnia sp.]